MKIIRFCCFLLILCFPNPSASEWASVMPPVTGVVTSRSLTAEQLVRDVFLKNGCKNVSNIRKIDNGLAVGSFDGAGAVFGFQAGVLLTSGAVELAEGPNEGLESTFDYNDLSDDPDMNLFSENPVFDVAGLQFDFIPVGEEVTFDYAFASEEYCEFVGSIFNDVFGFFVSGPGISGPYSNNSINVALVPNSNDFVAINTVNHQTNSDFYIKNELLEETDECNIPFAPQHIQEIGYDGMTKKLTATFSVIPCETYTIRLLVADVGDAILDSGVFLASKTFNLNGPVNVKAHVPGSVEPIVTEGCNEAHFLFSRTGNFSEDEVVYFDIDATSTAQAGIDYAPLPDSILIPAGALSAVLPVELISDAIPEEVEELSLYVSYPCDCLEPRLATLYIQDITPFSIETEPQFTCEGQTLTLAPIIIGGQAPYAYNWANGSTNGTLNLSVDNAGALGLTVTDVCGQEAIGVYEIDVANVPQAAISGTTTFCAGQDGFLPVTFEGTGPWNFGYSINDGATIFLSDIVENPFLLSVSDTGTYELRSFSDAFCSGTFSGTGLAEAPENLLQYTVQPVTCFDAQDGAIEWEYIGTDSLVEVNWNPAPDDFFQPTGLGKGNYELEIVNSLGCILREQIEVPLSSNLAPECLPFKLYVPNAFSPNGDGFNDEFRIYPALNSNVRKVRQLHIFNRWGATVYTNFDFLPDAATPLWDGIYQGKLMDSAIFSWQLIVELEDGNERVLSGDLLLVN